MDTVTCAYYDVSELADPILWERGMASLPWAQRRHKVGRFRFEKDKRLCLGAGLLAADMLQRAGATDLTLAYGEHGKPCLAHCPGIHFNLSHSGTKVACAVSTRPVGVDVEVVRDHGRAVAKRCFQGPELAWLDGQADVARAFTQLWVRKESYMKLVGAGLSLDPRAFSVLPGADGVDGVRFHSIAIDDVMVCACADDGQKVDFTEWNFK